RPTRDSTWWWTPSPSPRWCPGRPASRSAASLTRLSLRLAEAGGWRGTTLPLPPGRWADTLAPGREFTGHARVEDLFANTPVALLERMETAETTETAETPETAETT
ncbi:hypothetical protein ACWEWD_05740, partial [Streptomyces tendae]